MAMAKCKECQHEVSTKAKRCPSCGVKKPYKQEWKDVPRWRRRLITIIITLVVLAVIVNIANKEENLHKKVVALNDGQHKEKYEGYLELHYIDESNPEYIEKAIKHAKLYLQEVPVTKPTVNLAVYTDLAELDVNKKYLEKISFYTFMRDVRTKCVISAQDMSRNALNNKSTYDSELTSHGSWVDNKTYGYVDKFEGANSFGVVNKFTAQYLCSIDFDAREYSISRVSIVKE